MPLWLYKVAYKNCSVVSYSVYRFKVHKRLIQNIIYLLFCKFVYLKSFTGIYE